MDGTVQVAKTLKLALQNFMPIIHGIRYRYLNKTQSICTLNT